MHRTPTILALALAGIAALAATQPVAAKNPLDLAVHGNWCGPGARSGPVTDDLDAACRAHDLCARREGWFDCGCDLAFMDRLRRKSWPTEALYQKARAVYEAIALVPCRGVEGQITKLTWVDHDWRGAVASGRETPVDRTRRFLRLLADGVSTVDSR